MVKAILRSKSIGTKVTEEEYARLEELAATTGQSMSEWVRAILLDQQCAKSTNQLTNLTAGSVNLTYNYPTGTNNGKLGSVYNAVSGETVTYTYDSLNRLATAAGSVQQTVQWDQSYVFDAFGNLLQKNIVGGSAGQPSTQVTVNTANNRITSVAGLSYDANGNASTAPSMVYDVENRLSAANGLQYAYDGQNERIWSRNGQIDGSGNPTGYSVTMYSPTGQRLATYQLMPQWLQGWSPAMWMQVTLQSSDQYFGGRRVAALDQLGSVGTYFPWGENKGSTNPQNTWSFATYWRDSASGMDYANNRYYSNAYGRFMTPDPYKGNTGGAGNPNDPQSWNKYAYTAGDPVNRLDPTGQIWEETCGGFGDDGEGSASDDCGFIGINQGCGSVYVMTAIDGMQMPSPCEFLPVGGNGGGGAANVITLKVIDECIFPHGTGILPGAFTLAVEYQILVNGQPVLGNNALNSDGLSKITETVVTTGGGPVRGGGNWCISSANCDEPGSLSPSGTFWDILAGNGTVNQSFQGAHQTIGVTFAGGTSMLVLMNTYNSNGNSITVGGGALVGNSSVRECGTKNGDP